MFKKCLSYSRLGLTKNLSSLSLQHSTRTVLKFKLSTSYRAVTTLPVDTKPLLPLDRLRIAIMLPIAEELPSLDNPQLESEIFGKGSEPGYSTSNIYRQSFHPERLEFLGDRLFNYVACKVVFMLIVNRQTATFNSVTKAGLKLQNEQKYQQILVTNQAAASYAERYEAFNVFSAPKDKADRFEAYLTGLSFMKGDDAVVDFLAPLFKLKIEEIRNQVTGSLPALSSELLVPRAKQVAPMKSYLVDAIKFDKLLEALEQLKKTTPSFEQKVDGIFPPRLILKSPIAKSTSSKSLKVAAKSSTLSKTVPKFAYPIVRALWEKVSVSAKSSPPKSTAPSKVPQAQFNPHLAKSPPLSAVATEHTASIPEVSRASDKKSEIFKSFVNNVNQK